MEKRRINKMQIILIIIYLVLTLSGLILMKKGGNPGSFSVKDGSFSFGMSLVSLAGFICYLGSFLLFTRMVVMFDLSYIMPLVTGIVQILTLVASKIFFNEEISTYGIVGACFVIIGIVVMNWKH